MLINKHRQCNPLEIILDSITKIIFKIWNRKKRWKSAERRIKLILINEHFFGQES